MESVRQSGCVLPDSRHLGTILAIYRSADPRSEATIAQIAAGNPSFFSRIRSGGSCTIRLYLRTLRWFSDNWPEHLEWPPDVPRPEPTSAKEEAA